MLPVSETAIRLFLHVLAAAIWVGGQITLAGGAAALLGALGALFVGVQLRT